MELINQHNQFKSIAICKKVTGEIKPSRAIFKARIHHAILRSSKCPGIKPSCKRTILDQSCHTRTNYKDRSSNFSQADIRADNPSRSTFLVCRLRICECDTIEKRNLVIDHFSYVVPLALKPFTIDNWDNYVSAQSPWFGYFPINIVDLVLYRLID